MKKMKYLPAKSLMKLFIPVLCALYLPVSKGQSTPDQKNYDFSYVISGPSINVFDDGKNTRIQLPEGTLIPVIVSTKPRGDVLLTPKRQTSFLMVDGLHTALRLIWANRREVTARYSGTAQRQAQAAAFGAVQPTQIFTAVSEPAQAVPGQTSRQLKTALDIVHQEFATQPALELSDEQVSQVQTAPVAQPGRPIPQAAIKEWNIRVEDIRLGTTLKRWSHDAGMRLLWDARQDVLITSDDSFTGTFEQALQRTLSSPAIRLSAYPLEACIYPNTPEVLRITRLGEQTRDCP